MAVVVVVLVVDAFIAVKFQTIRLDCSVLVPVLVFAAASVHMSSCRFRRYIEKRFWLWLLLWLLALSHCRGCASCGHCGGCAFVWCCVCGRRHHCNLCHHCCPRCQVDLVIHGVAVVVFAAHCSCNCCVCYRCGDAYSRRCCCGCRVRGYTWWPSPCCCYF